MSEFKTHQRVYVEGHKGTKWSWGCLTLGGDICIVLSDSGGYMSMPLSRVSATPFKTDLEIAKEKQISDLKLFVDEVTSSMRYAVGGNNLLFKEMQDAGLLAEIILPLESE